MPKLNQQGVTHIFLILFLLAGLAVTIYLVQQRTNIFPKAYVSGPISTVPAKPYGLTGQCYQTPGSWKTTAVVSWKPGDEKLAVYFVRYKRQLPASEGTSQYNSWWPSDPSDGANIFPGLQLSALPGQKFEVWGVYACNLNGCTDFVRGEAFDCLNPIPTQVNTLDYANATVPEWGADMTAPIPQD